MAIVDAKLLQEVEELAKNGQFNLHISTQELQLIQSMPERD